MQAALPPAAQGTVHCTAPAAAATVPLLCSTALAHTPQAAALQMPMARGRRQYSNQDISLVMQLWYAQQCVLRVLRRSQCVLSVLLLRGLQLRSSLRPAGWALASVGSRGTVLGVVVVPSVVLGGSAGLTAGGALAVVLPRGVQPGTTVGAVAAILWLKLCTMPKVVSPERMALSPRVPASPSHCDRSRRHASALCVENNCWQA